MKSEKTNRPPAGESWVWITRDLICSDAWRSAAVSTRRVVDYLLLEHMRKGGKHNGQLKAPYRQLIAFGVGARYAGDAIREAEQLGLIDCTRGGMRVATTYALTWLPSHDGTPASNRWRSYRNAELPPIPSPKIRNLPAKGNAGLPAKGNADGPSLPAKCDADAPVILPAKGNALSRISLARTGKVYSSISADGALAAASATGPVPLAVGARRCGE